MKQKKQERMHTYQYNQERAEINRQNYKSNNPKSAMNPWKIIGIIFISPVILAVGMLAVGLLLVVGIFYLLWELIKAICFASFISDILK